MFRSPAYRSPMFRSPSPKRPSKPKESDLLDFIQIEFQLGKTVCEAFEKFCQFHGENSIKYKEFNCLYYRFSNGHYDLKQEVEFSIKEELLDENDNLMKEILGLVDMPMDILEKIVGNLNFEERFIIRKVCRLLRNFIDNTRCQYSKLFFRVFETHTKLKFNNQSVDYQPAFDGLLVQSEEKYKMIDEKEDWKVALNDMKSALKHPNVEVKKLLFEFNSFISRSKRQRIVETTRAALSLIGHRIHAKFLSLKVHDQDEVLAILKFLEPGALECIEIRHSLGTMDYIEMDEIVEMDQWKKLTNLQIDSNNCKVEDLMHFRKIDAILVDVKAYEVVELKDALYHSDNFQSCHLTFTPTGMDMKILKAAMGATHIPMEEANRIFVIEYGELSVSFKKYKQNSSS